MPDLKPMSKVQATVGLANPRAILARRPLLKRDADVVCQLCASVGPRNLLLCGGAHL